MANFTTHIAVGTVVAGALATLTLAADVVAPENLVAVTMAGVLGSVLPDIDLKDSRPSRAMFAGLGVFFSFVALFNAATKLSVAELWILWLGTLVAVRYGLHAIFHRVARHRGIWHSVLAALFSSVATAVVYYHVLGRHEGVAWLAAAFMMAGFLTHLALDEMYSVDVMDTRVKASFGTALKLIDTRHLGASFGMAAATVAAVMLSPPTKTFVDGVGSPSLWTGLHQRILPSDGTWFGVISPHKLFARAETKSSELTTGSLPDASAAAKVIVKPAVSEPVLAAPQATAPAPPTPSQPAAAVDVSVKRPPITVIPDP
ncbi:MAG: metal-dependent hydrolase [Hyphomicrobium sp.]